MSKNKDFGFLDSRSSEGLLEFMDPMFQFLIDQIPVIFWSTDREFRITSSLGAGLSLMSLQPNQLVGVNLLEYVRSSSDDPSPILAHERALEGESTTYEMQYLGRVFRAHVEPLRTSVGEISGTIGLAFDITATKKTEHELDKTISLLRATLESTIDGILVVDREGRWVSFNRQFVGMWRIPESIVVSRDEALMLAFVLDQLKEADGFIRKVKELYIDPDAESFDILEFKDGRVFERYSKPQRIGGESVGRVWSFSDVTERKRAEEIQSALYRITEITASAKDMLEFYMAVHVIIGELMYAQNFYIALWDPLTELLSFPYFQDQFDSPPAPKALGKGLTEYVLRHGRGLLATPEQYEELVKQSEVEGYGAASVDWLGMPLKSEGVTFGVIVVQSYDEKIRFGEKEEDLLNFVSQHIAAAIERKQAAQALEKSEERYRAFVEHSSEAVCRFEFRQPIPVSLPMEEQIDLSYRHGYLAECNDVMAQMYGFGSAREMVGVRLGDLLIRDDPRNQEYLRAFIHSEYRLVDAESYELDKNGNAKCFSNTLVGIVENGALVRTWGTQRDITTRKKAERELDQSLSLHRATLESTADGILVVDDNGKITSFNRRFIELWQIPEDVIASRDDNRALAFVRDQLLDPEGFLLRVRELYNQPESESMDEVLLKDGRVLERYSCAQRIGGKSVGRVWSFRDVTERRKAEEALRLSEERYALAVRGAFDGLWDWNFQSNEVYFSPRWKSMLGYSEEEVGNVVEEWFQRVHPDDLSRLKAEIAAHLEVLSPHFENEHRIRHRDGMYRWVMSRGLSVRDKTGKAYRLVGSQTDVTDRKVAEERLLHEAIHDVLTGLPNRALFMDLLGRSLGRAKRREDYKFGVLFLDLDRFKVVNDSLGHMVGDQLLVAIARRLETCLRPGDTVARLGGDEFTVLLEDVHDAGDAIHVAERIQQELMQPFSISDHEVFTTASIGIALSATGYDRPEELLRDADTAMYRAKAAGKATHQVFDTAMHSRAVAQLQLETSLRRALERGEFRLYYQPTVSLKTGKLAGFEALIRWQHPEKGIVIPAEFIPHAEETGLILPIGRWVLREACRQMKAWQKQFSSSLSMSVNLSSKQFLQVDLVDQVAGILRKTGLDPHGLMLEITESTIMENPEGATAMLNQLRELNVQMHVDDFGTGYSSLSYLHRFPIDALKIDRSFVSRMGIGDENLEIVRTVVNLAHNLGMEVIAEGVESAEQLAQLKALNCQYAQGYYFSKPVEQNIAQILIAAKPVW